MQLVKSNCFAFHAICICFVVVGCTDTAVDFLFNDKGVGVACYGDSFFLVEGGVSLNKRIICENSCIARGFHRLVGTSPEYMSQYKAISSNNLHNPIPDNCI